MCLYLCLIDLFGNDFSFVSACGTVCPSKLVSTSPCWSYLPHCHLASNGNLEALAFIIIPMIMVDTECFCALLKLVQLLSRRARTRIQVPSCRILPIKLFLRWFYLLRKTYVWFLVANNEIHYAEQLHEMCKSLRTVGSPTETILFGLLIL